MPYHPDDTICAIGTASGGAARGMVRISGTHAVAVATRVFTADDASLEDVRQPTVVSGRLRIAGEFNVPCELFLWPTTRSYTRDPVAELHTIGSSPILEATVASVCAAGARLAEPGEFTLRAFLAGRLDLTQAEAVLGVIDATEGGELDAALAQLAGGLARPLDQLRNDLFQLLAELEAGLDFVEEDIRFISHSDVLRRLQSASELLGDVSRQIESRHAATTLNEVALVGPPNVGKSSLFNTLVERYADVDQPGASQASPAIVSPHRGTTRDYLTTTISIDGLHCRLIDTAGVDAAADLLATPIDTLAQSHATERRKRATVRAICIPATEPLADVCAENCDLVVITKSDLAAADCAHPNTMHHTPVVITSSRSGAGLDEFCRAVRTLLIGDVQPRRGTVVITTAERCGESIRLAASSSNAAIELVKMNAGDELVAAELRAALAELGKVVGAIYTDDLLDRIFKTFCIGK